MTQRLHAWTVSLAMTGTVAGCASPMDQHRSLTSRPSDQSFVHDSAFRPDVNRIKQPVASLPTPATPDDFVRYAVFNSPRVEAAYQRWLATAEQLPRVPALPDPRLTVGFFLDEVETRAGPQQARVGISQAFPWPGILGAREDAAGRAARAAWREFEAEKFLVIEFVVRALHELAYLDAAIRITHENLELLESFEEVVRARYRVGAGSHPELMRVQVELGQLEDRAAQLIAMRPAYVAELNAVMNRPVGTAIHAVAELPGRVISIEGPELSEIARTSNPTLLALDEQIEEARLRADVARLEGRPDFMVGLDYIVTDDAMDSSIPESGDDPILLSFGVTLPLWREKYGAGVRAATAQRLAVSSERHDKASMIAAAIQRAWFEHTDADRRVRLFEQTLIPKAEQSLRASLAGFRGGETSFLDLLDTERTLFQFAVEAERARADRGQALALLERLVGAPVPTRGAGLDAEEVTP